VSGHEEEVFVVVVDTQAQANEHLVVASKDLSDDRTNIRIDLKKAYFHLHASLDHDY
jgi:hypothetical protein